MKHKLATIPAVVAALIVSALAVNTGGSPAGAAPKPSPTPATVSWRIEDYGPRAGDNAILSWNQQLLDTIKANPAATGPTRTARFLGMVHTATYDAWAAYDGVAKGTRLGSQLRQPPAERTLANKTKAISYAAHRTLVSLFPSRKPIYDAALTGKGYPLSDSTDRTTPEGVGNTAAQAVLDFRSTDGSTATSSYTPVNKWNEVTNPAKWQPLCVLTPAGVAAGAPMEPTDGTCVGPHYSVQAPLTPQWGNVTMFSTVPASQYGVYGPPVNPDGTYSTAEIDQEVADAANLDDVKKAKAEYWADGPGSVFPPGHDFIFAQAVSRKRGYTLDQDVKTFFTLGNAMMDASIASWWQKYKYDCARPITAIRHRKAGTLVNSWLGPNKGFGMVDGSKWIPYQALHVVTPAFPEYVSGHSTFSGAGMAILAWMTGSETFGATVTIPKNSLTIEQNIPAQDVVFSFPTWSQTGEDAGTSRRIGGIHFKTGDWNGRALGRQVATNVYSQAQRYIRGMTSG
jgi:hypothetical protein